MGRQEMSRTRVLLVGTVGALAIAAASLAPAPLALASGGHGKAAKVDETMAPAAKQGLSEEQAAANSAGCISCHTSSDSRTMHTSGKVEIGCTDCHGGNAAVMLPAGASPGDARYQDTQQQAHVQPRYPHAWERDHETGELPVRTYTLLNEESSAYVRFINPGDLRIADYACGACHGDIVEANRRSLMSTAAMFFTGAAYNNGIVPFKRSFIGEQYTQDGTSAGIQLPEGTTLSEAQVRAGVIPRVVPLPRWETTPPGDNFRVFERGGRLIGNLFPEIGLPNIAPGFDEPGRPDVRQSNRGPGTGSRISVPVLNIHKTRLNDPYLWFLGTNDNPGDFRSSGCSACHVVYANDRDPISSGVYAKYGHWGQSATVDPTIAALKSHDGEPERGHPIRHEFSRSIPTSTCMTCHMHQPNMFVNPYLGFTMWDYESNAPQMWPEEQRYPSIEEIFEINSRNPEEAAIRGKWSDTEFMSRVTDDVNPVAKDTQFADYHGHGWNFRAVHKRARDGSLLDAEGAVIPDDLPPAEKWQRAVHMRDIHADAGMQCADCHYAQDAHGNGNVYGEVAAQVEIRCRDCHGTSDQRATLNTSGPAAPEGGSELGSLLNADGNYRFEWEGDQLYQRLIMPPHEKRRVKQVVDIVNPRNSDYNEKAARHKLVSTQSGEGGSCERAHDSEEMSCFACHSSWVTSCAGCHLPVQANWKTERHHYEGGETRNFATYNPQVAREAMFQLGKHGEVKDGVIAPIRSSSALVLSSQDISRNRIYVQQPPISASGFSSQAFAPHFPHTVRTTETKQCADCHVSSAGDNNAVMAQLLLLGTNFVNFVGYNAWVGEEKAITAIQVTEFDEPQAVIGSYLQKYAYPDYYAEHLARERELTRITLGTLDADPGFVEGIRRFFQGDFFGRSIYDGTYGHHSGRVGCLQLRGEYLFVAEGSHGMQAYDVQAIGNKGFSERIVSAPFSALGHKTRIKSKTATCVALPTNQPVRPDRNRAQAATEMTHQGLPEKNLLDINAEQPMHAIYSYAAVTDSEEGLILVDVETLANFEPRDNFFERALTWNPDGLLDGARYAHFAGHNLYVTADRGVIVIDLDNPLEPKLLSVIELPGARGSILQFRYLFVTDAEGLKVVDVTNPAAPRVVPGATIPLRDAHRVFVARTYAYVAAGAEGLAIIDVERPEKPRLLTKYTADGKLNDARDVVVATTNASLFAYVADGENGLKVLQLTSPDSQPKFYGFSPEPHPELIAWRKTHSPALSLSRGLERDRGVDETGHQIAVFGRVGSRPFNQAEMEKLFLSKGKLWTVSDDGKIVGMADDRCVAGSQ